MLAGGVNIGDLITVIYGLLPLLLDFNLSVLFLEVVEGSDVTMLADFMCPVLMIFGRLDLQVDLVLIMAMSFQLQVNLPAVRYDCIIAVRNFLDDIITVDPLVIINFAVLLASEVCIADTEVGEFNLVSRLAGDSLMVGIVAVLDLEGIAVHFIHFECEHLVFQVGRQLASVLVFEGLGNVDALFYIGLVISGFEIVVPFSCGVEVFPRHHPAGAGAVVLVNSGFWRKENTGRCIDGQAAGIISVENDVVQDVFFYFAVMARISVFFDGTALQAADHGAAAFVLDSNFKLLDVVVPAVGHVKDNGLSFVFDDFPAVLRHNIFHVRTVDVDGTILSLAERGTGQVDRLVIWGKGWSVRALLGHEGRHAFRITDQRIYISVDLALFPRIHIRRGIGSGIPYIGVTVGRSLAGLVLVDEHVKRDVGGFTVPEIGIPVQFANIEWNGGITAAHDFDTLGVVYLEMLDSKVGLGVAGLIILVRDHAKLHRRS